MKIPKRLKDEFIYWMDEHNHDEAPDGAWFAMLEDAGEEFIQLHKLGGPDGEGVDGNDLAHEYLAYRAERREQCK